MSAKAKTIRDAIDAVARSLDFPLHAVAMQPGREAYNLDTLWRGWSRSLEKPSWFSSIGYGLAVQRLA